MQAQNNDFINQFDSAMANLQRVKQNIQAGIDFKTTFTNDLKTQLGRINERMGVLAGLIRTLKQRADGLEQDIADNTGLITQKDNELQQLRQQVQDLTVQRDNLANQLADQQRALQGTIDQQEQQLRQLNQEKTTLENQVQALRTDLENRGDPAAHAAEIQRITDESEQRLQQLNNTIAEKQQRVEALERQLQEREQADNQQQQDLARQQVEVQDRITQLTNQINDLTQRNESLKNKLIAATDAIVEASNTLQQITDNVPNVNTKREVDDLIRQITEQIEASIENISRAAQGHPARGQGQAQAAAIPPQNVQQGRFPFQDAEIQLYDSTAKRNIPLTIGQLADLINTKANQMPKPNNYSKALNELRNIQDIAQVQPILNRYNLNFKNRKISGGRKTRKIRRQKGGFVYKTTSKRRSITSSSGRRSSRRSSRNSSRKSSR